MSARGRRFIIFSLHGERYALNVEELAEVMEMPRLFPIPWTPDHYLGIMNFHGAPTPVLDLASFLRGTPLSASGKLLVLDRGTGSLAFRIDSVERIVSDIRGLRVQDDAGQYRRLSVLFDNETIPLLATDMIIDDLEEKACANRDGNGTFWSDKATAQ